MKKNNRIALMAIASGGETTEYASSKKYTGIAACTLLAVNPNKDELSKIFASDNGPANIEKEPEYTGTDGSGVDYIRIDLYMQTIPEKSNGIKTVIKIGYFIRNTKRFNRDNSKLQVINAYGDSTWLTQAQFDAKTPPETMPNYQMKNVRPAFAGEEEFVKFLKRFLVIPAYSYKKGDGTIVTVADSATAECQLGAISEYFKGNISEIKTPLMARKGNKIKFLFGVKTTAENKSYQDCFIQMPVGFSTSNYDKLIEAMMKRKEDNAFQNTDFGTSPFIFQEWTLTPTQLSSSPATNPFGTVPQAQTPANVNWNFGANADEDLPN